MNRLAMLWSAVAVIGIATTAGDTAGAALATGAVPAPRLCSQSHVNDACLRPLDVVELEALQRRLGMLLASADQRCRALGEYIATHAADARIVPYPILTRYGLATADAHAAPMPAGTGRVHVADSVLTRDGAFARPTEAKIHSIVHDFAHLVMQLPQDHFFIGGDPAGDIADGCLG